MPRASGGTATSVTLGANSSVNLNQVGGTNISLGQTTMVGSIPVVLASNQASIPVTLSGNVTVVQSTAANLLATVNIAAAQTLSTVTTVSTVSNLSQIASTTPTFGDINNSTTEAGALDVALIGRYNATLPTITDTRYNQLQIGARGSLQINILDSGGTTGAAVSARGLTIDTNGVAGNAVSTAGSGTQLVGLADGANNKLTSNSTTLSSKFALDSNLLSIDGTLAVTGGVAGTLAVGGNQATNTVVSTNTNPVLVAGSDYGGTAKIQSMKVDSTGKQFVNTVDTVTTVTTLTSITNTVGTNVAQINGHTTVEGGANGVLAIGGKDASGASTTTNPVQQGALAATALPAAVSGAQVVENMADKFGRQVVITSTVRDLVGSQTTTLSNTTSETTIVTQAASVFNDLLSIIAINTSAAATRVDFRDTTNGTIIFALYLPAGDTRGISWQVPLPQSGVNTNWTAQCSTGVTDVRIMVQFAKNK